LIAGTGLASRAASGAASPAALPVASGAAAERGVTRAAINDGALLLEFDAQLRSRASRLRRDARGQSSVPLTPWAATEYLVLAGGSRVDEFAMRRAERRAVDTRHGPGTSLTLSGSAAQSIEKTVRIELLERYPGFAFFRVSYRNSSASPVVIEEWRNAELTLLSASAASGSHPSGSASDTAEFWSFCGSTHADRRDWVQPVGRGFSQPNDMGMTASDYGGGTPIVDVWRRDGGIAVGHLESTPRAVSLPVKHVAHGVSLAIAGTAKQVLAPGEEFASPETFIATHVGDYFATLDTYRRIMAERGLASPHPPRSAYEPIWCAWGYERECTPALISTTLPKVRELGLSWAVIDDGWQSDVGDWRPDPRKYPQGGADIQALVQDIRAHSLKPRLWVAPLAAAPGSDLLHDHTDMLLLDRDGAPQNISWWNSFYLCPAYAKTVEYTESLVQRFIGEWRFAGLKVDGQHLNGVAPCYNPLHRHARPEESVEKLQDLLHAMYARAVAIDPEVVMELCPCGTCYSFFNLPAMNQAPASDPESSWQVRHKGKTLKALMGPSAAFAGDHVELSDGGADFASTVGIGAIISTKFTWPRDPKPKDSFLLTPEKEAVWRRWIALYSERVLPTGIYRGELYDIGFDKPETHAVERSGRWYYAFYARSWRGPVALRGLPSGRHRVRDYFNGLDIGEVTAPGALLDVAFNRFLLVETTPL
jgi:alpha-galactosidase